MRHPIFTLIAALAATGAGMAEVAAVENCRTGDAAICGSEPNCHWDYERRGCYEGAPARQDACVAHSDQTICDADTTLGCKWDAEEKRCKSAK